VPLRILKLSTIIALIVLIGITAYFYTACKPVWQFDHLEQNARKVITAAELQQWATNFLVQYPPETSTDWRMRTGGTNFPAQLRSSAPKLGPIIWTHPAFDTNTTEWVTIYWGSGFLGSHGFEIGPTNFVSPGPSRQWAPGVYYFDK